MLSQLLRKSAPFVSILLAASGCGGDADIIGSGDVDAEAAWVANFDAYVYNLFVEPGRGDTLLVDDGGIARIDAAGASLFRHNTNQIQVDAAAFTPEGNTVLLTGCTAPISFAGLSLCEDSDPQFGSFTMVLVELARDGSALRSVSFAPTTSGIVSAQSIAIGDDGAVHIGGTFFGTVDFGDGELVASTQSLFYLQLTAAWEPQLSRNFGADSGYVSDITLDASTGDVFMVGGFSGNARFDGINLTNGPSGNAIFLVRLSDAAKPRWAKHFLGSGRFDAQFDTDGGLLIYGRGDAPFTSLGGNNVIDGPFASKLDANGEHQWTWRVHDSQSGATATIDSEGRIVALYNEQTLIKPAVEPAEDCFYDDYWDPDCEYQPAEYINRRLLRVMSPDGTVLGGINLGSSEYGSVNGTLAAGPNGTIMIAATQNGQEGIDFGTGPHFSTTVLAKLQLLPSD